MEKQIQGLHHITVLASDPQQNYDFYTKVIGLRFVKKTVNFDAPDVYHFYFADEVGTPGTVLTFFPFPQAARGRRGSGEATTVSFSIPHGSMSFWIERLSRYGVDFKGPLQKFKQEFIAFTDPDGMHIELIEDDVQHLIGWETRDLPREHSIRKFFGTTVRLRHLEGTVNLVHDILGFQEDAAEGNLKRYISGNGDDRARFDIEADPQATPALQAAGSVHHLAWRTRNYDTQQEWIQKLRSSGFFPTASIDRNYFRSIYFREPGGVLFEIATDDPGFMVDEEKSELGRSLKLPQMYEHQRSEIENRLLPIEYSDSSKVA